MAKLTLAIQLDGTTMHQIQLGNMNTLGFIVISSAPFLSLVKSAQDSENLKLRWLEHHYRCESGWGGKRKLTPPPRPPSFSTKGHSYRMEITIPGSGARYVGGGLEWWSKAALARVLKARCFFTMPMARLGMPSSFAPSCKNGLGHRYTAAFL